MPGNQYTSSEYIAQKERDLKCFITETNPDMEYVSGYSGVKNPVLIRHKTCGNTYSKSMETVRKGRAMRCPFCNPPLTDEQKRDRKNESSRKRARIKREKEADIILRRKIERHERALKNEALRKQAAIDKREARRHPCPVCGTSTTRIKYCSDVCQNKAVNTAHEAKRRVRIREKMVDKDITLERLYLRDGGHCWICGLPCTWDDKEETEKAIVCGNLYPSIDHLIPLSEGGEHSWKNVKLAHRICNTDRYKRPPRGAVS